MPGDECICGLGFEADDRGGCPVHPAKPITIAISPSQIATWDLCQRKWAFVYIGKIRPPSNKSAALGDETHGVLEAYVRDGVPLPMTPSADGSPTPGEIATQAVPHLPATVVAVEADFRIAVTPGGTVIGDGDVERAEATCRYWRQDDPGTWPDGSPLVVVALNGRIDLIGAGPVVIDYKTSGDPGRYAKSAEDLLTDPAAIAYAAAVELGTDSEGPTDLEWLYLRTKRPLGRAMPVRQRVEGRRSLPLLAPSLAGIVNARLHWTTPEDAPGNVQACGAFGGCYFRDRCTIASRPSATFAAARHTIANRTTEVDPMDLQAMLAAAQANNPGAFTADAPPAPPAPVPAPQAAPTPAAAPSPVFDFASLGIKMPGATQNDAPAMTQAPAPVVSQVIAPAVPTGRAEPVSVAPATAAPLSTGGEGEAAGYLLYVDAVPFRPRRDVTYASDLIRAVAKQLEMGGVADYRAVAFSDGQGKMATLLGASLTAYVAKPVRERLPVVLMTDSAPERAMLDVFERFAASVVRGVR